MAGSGLSGGVRSYGDLLRQPHVAPVVAWGLVARMPIGMLALALVLLIRGTGGTYAEAGLATAAEALAAAAGAPVAGRLVDRRRPARVLGVYGAAFVTATVALIVLARAGAPLPALMAAALAVGAAQPPVPQTIRMLWPSLVSENRLMTAFSLEATLQEVFFIAGPLVVGALTALVSTTAGAVAVAVISAIGVTGLALTPAVRSCQARGARGEGHPLRALTPPLVRRIIAFTWCYGLVFGAVEVAMPAFAEDHGGRALGGICLACWSAGSLAGGLLAAGHRPVDPMRRLWLISSLLAAGLLLPLAADSIPAMAVIMFLIGLPIAPSFALTYGMVQGTAAEGTQAEVFGWLTTAVVVGVALGTGAGGGLITHIGTSASFLLGCAGGVAASFVALASMRAPLPQPVTETDC